MPRNEIFMHASNVGDKRTWFIKPLYITDNRDESAGNLSADAHDALQQPTVGIG